MSHRFLVSMVVVVAVVSLAPAPAAGQVASSGAQPTTEENAWTPPRTPWGEPDLQGVWDYRTITPLERPSALAENTFLRTRKRRTLKGKKIDTRIVI